VSQLGLFGAAPPEAPAAIPAEPVVIFATESLSLPPAPAPAPAAPAAVERRWVVCPDRATGSMDAVPVDPDAWEAEARAMALAERESVSLYAVEPSGAWSCVGRVDATGRRVR